MEMLHWNFGGEVPLPSGYVVYLEVSRLQRRQYTRHSPESHQATKTIYQVERLTKTSLRKESREIRL
jgi:hypothetical protein